MSLNKNKIQYYRSNISQISWLPGISGPNLSFENCVMRTSQMKAKGEVLTFAKNPEYEIKFSK